MPAPICHPSRHPEDRVVSLAEKITPTRVESKDKSDEEEEEKRVRGRTAMPKGVTSANTIARPIFLQNGRVSQFSVAIRLPNPTPSSAWWKTMAMKYDSLG